MVSRVSPVKVVDDVGGVRAESAGVVAFVRFDDIDQVVGHSFEIPGGRFGGADVHVAKHLCRVDADELDGQLLRKLHGQRRLAAGGGAHDQERAH